MAHGKNKRTVIQVKSAPTTNVVYNLVDIPTDNNRNVQHFKMLPQLLEVKPLWTEDATDTADDLDGDSKVRHSESAEDYVTEMKQITPRDDDDDDGDDGQHNMEDGLVGVNGVNMKTEDMAEDVNAPSQDVAETKDESKNNESEKKTKKKKKKGNKKKTTGHCDVPESCIQDGRAVRLEPINRATNTSDVLKSDAKPKLKPTGCFGFVSTWLAKRKEKRRQKKKKAINARKEANTEPLVEYEHRRAKGGVAFTVELDSRPIMKSVLPPIKQTPGPIRMATEQKLEHAENNRTEHINKRKENARAHSRMVQEVADRRIENEMIFKQTTLLKIRDKEFKASRASSRLEYDRNMRCRSRCNSRMRHTPDIITSKPKITLSSSPIAEVNEKPPISPFSLDDVPRSQCTIGQDGSYMIE